MVNELQEVQWAYLIDPCFQIENTAGRPVTGGWINIYIAGTRTKYYAASDFTGTLHPFNIPLDSLGSNIILVSPANKYDVFVYNKYGTLVMSRANVSPQVAGTSIVSGGVVLDSSDGTVDVSVSGTTYDISIAGTVDRVESLETVVDSVTGDITVITDTVNGLVSGKKDIQAPYSATGSPTKTVTAVTQDANGVITVTYSDIDLPQQVPNIEIESSTLDVVSSIDPETNTKTFTIDTRSVTGDASFAYGDPTDTSYIANPRTSPTKLAGSNPVRKAGNDISYDGLNRRFVLKAGVYFVNFNVEASTNSVDDSTQQVYAEIGGSYPAHDRGTVTLDRTVSGQKSEIDLSSIIFAPNDNYVIEIDMGADSDVPVYGKVSHWDIFRIDRGGISGGSVPGHEYLAGWGIEIDQDDRISVDPTILDGYVTDGELSTAIDTVTGMIPEAQVQADWTETDPLDPSYINNKPDLNEYVTQDELASAVSGLAPEYTAGSGIDITGDTISVDDTVALKSDIPEQEAVEFLGLVAGNNITLTESSTGLVIDSTGGSTYTAGTGIDISNDVISVDSTVAMKTDIPQQEEVEFTELTAGDNISIASGTISLNDVITINARDTSSGYALFGNIVHWGEQDYGPGWNITGRTDNDRDYVSYNTTDHGLQNFFWGEYGADRDTASVSGESMIQISEGDIKYKAGVFQNTDTLPIVWSCSQMARDISELQEAVTGMPDYTAGDGIDITNDEISAKLGANMSFDSNDAITVDLNGVAEDAAGLVSGNIPQMELIAGDNIQLATSGVSAVINAVLPPATQDVVHANSYDNPGWETTGTVTTYNPFGLAIHPDLAYSSYTIYTSRLCVKNIGNGLFYLDLFVSMTGRPRAEYTIYQDYITLASGHFICPTLSNVYDEWGNRFGCIHKSTLYGTSLDYTSLSPEADALDNRHYIQLHAVVASW